MMMAPPSRSRRPLVLALLVLACAAWAAPAAAIYEDQAGTYDWYKQYVGRPTSAAFLPGKERVFVATQLGVLASLQTQSGGVAWRRKHAEPDALDGMLALKTPAVVVAASNGGKLVRAWEAMDGGFKWEALVFEGAPAAAGSGSPAAGLAAVQLEGAKTSSVAVAAGDTIKLLGASKGDTLWSSSLADASSASSRKLVVVQGDTVTVAAYSPGSQELHVTALAATDGSVTQPEQRLTATAPLSGVAATSGGSIALLSQDGRQLCTLSGTKEAVSCQELSSLAPNLAAAGLEELRLAPAAPGAFTLSSPAGGALIAASDGGPARQAAWLAGQAAASPAAPLLAGAGATEVLALAASAPDASSVHVRLVDAATGQQLEAADVAVPPAAYPTAGPAPRVVAAWLDASAQREPSGVGVGGSLASACRLLLLWSDDRVSFVERGQEAWAREEALASGTASLMVDLPARAAGQASGGDDGGSEDGAAGAAGGGSSKAGGGLLALLRDNEALKRWVRLQVLGVLIQFRLNTDPEKEEFLQLRQALSDNNLPYRDANGFRKLIILLTAPGKVFALHSGDGRIVWASSAALLPAGGGDGGDGARQYLRLWRRFHDLTHAPQVAVLTAGRGSGAVHVMNGHTGQLLQELELPYGVEKVIPLHAPVHDGAAEQSSFLFVEREGEGGGGSAPEQGAPPRVHLIPDTPAARGRLSAAADNTFFWLLEQQQGAADGAGGGGGGGGVHTVLRGYGFEAGAQPDGETGLLPVVPAWQAVLPGSLLAVAAKDPGEPLYSYVKVLGDRSLKYKYVNPNLLFVATATGGGADGGDGGVSAVLLNTVSGAVVHQALHAGASGPVRAVMSEHWVVYTLWDAAELRQQATVIELYDASPRDLSIEAIIAGTTQHAGSFSSYGAVQLEVLSQSFYLQHPVRDIGVSQTLQGITTKQLLLQTVNDQVYALDKRFLDPRRPVGAKATPQEAEEGLVPYSELIVFNPLAYPTQDKQVLNLRGVASVPAVLESTSLVFCYGSELFYTRITPAAHFDSLQSDFSYGLLVVALLALVAGTWFAKYSSQQVVLKSKWE